MESPEPASPPSRRHRRPGRPAARTQPASRPQRVASPDLATAFHGLVRVVPRLDKGKGKVREPIHANDGVGEVDPVSKGGGTVRELKRPHPQRDELSLPPRPRAPRPTQQRQYELVDSSRHSPSSSVPDDDPQQLVLVSPATRTRTHSHGKTPDPTWAARVLSPIVRQQAAGGEFARNNKRRREGAKEGWTSPANFDKELGVAAPTLTDEFLIDVLPNRTRKTSKRHTFLGGGGVSEQGRKRKKLDSSSEDEEQEDLRKPQSGRPRGRVPRYLGAPGLHDSVTSDEKRLLKAPYRTSSTYARKLSFSRPSQTDLDHDGVPGSIKTCKPQREEAGAKVKRLEPGRSPRSPFLHSIAQTSFTPLIAKQSVKPGLKRITTIVGLELEGARASEDGRHRKKARKNEAQLSRPGGGRSERLTMVDEEEAGYVAQIAPKPTFRHEPPTRVKKVKPARKTRSKAPTDRFRFVPVRRPPPFRPFANNPPPLPLVPFTEASRSLANANVSPAVGASKASTPTALPPQAKQTKFRFITGPKAKRAPTVDEGWWQPGQEKPVKPSQKPRLMRRLSTRPDFQIAFTPSPESKLPGILEEPLPADDRHDSSHSCRGTPSSSTSPRSNLPRTSHPSVLPDSFDFAKFPLSSLPPPAQLAQPAQAISAPSQPRPSQLDDYFASESSSFERQALVVAEEEEMFGGDFLVSERELDHDHDHGAQDELDPPSPLATRCGHPAPPQPVPTPKGGWWRSVPTLSAVLGQRESQEVNVALLRARGRTPLYSVPSSFSEDSGEGGEEQQEVPASAALVEEEEGDQDLATTTSLAASDANDLVGDDFPSSFPYTALALAE
ncbi:hypothetical protein JCM5296_005928 [Sporobolomyces johnsonii]